MRKGRTTRSNIVSCQSMKGQVEFVAILGVIIVAVIVVLYATQMQQTTQPVSQEHKPLRSSIENLIRSGADETIRTLSTYGGYSSPPTNSVTFLGKNVPYWQKNGASTTPSVKATFTQRLEDFINENKDSFVSGLGNDINMGKASVTANFLTNKIIVTVNLPATLNDQQLSPRYDVEVLTHFGEILDFSEEFIQAQSKDRYFETFTMGSILASPMKNDQQVTPIFIYLARCGDYVFRSWNDVKSSVEDRIETTLAHTYMPDKVPLNIGDITPYPKYPFPRLNGKTYADIDVTFHLPDNFRLDASQFQFSPNPIVAIASPLGFTGICVSDPIYVNYFIHYPMIVRAKDPLTQNVFQFATDVFIKDNVPGEWSDQQLYEQSQLAQICNNPLCTANIDIVNLDGGAVPGADISFMGCSIGETNSQGKLQVAVPCGLGPLQIYENGYQFYGEMRSYSELSDLSLTLLREVHTKVTLYNAVVSNNTITQEYSVDSVTLLPADEKVLLTATSYTLPTTANTIHQRIYDATGLLENIPSDTYSISATILNEDFTASFGSSNDVVSLTEKTTDLHIYIPTIPEFSQITDTEESARLMAVLSIILETCGIGPISETSLDTDELTPCKVGYGEVNV